MVWIKAATKLCKLKCKAGLSTTMMKSHIKPNRESVCTGGNESEAKPTGSSASYLVPLFLHYHYPAHHSPCNFLPFFCVISFLSFPGYLYNLSLMFSPHLPSFPSLHLSCSPIIFLSSSLLPSGCFLLSFYL